MIKYFDLGVVWYAMKTTYKKELQAKAYLEARSIECFIPMDQSIQIKLGRKTVTSKPAIHNLIFVKANLSQLNEIKQQLTYLHNRLTRCDDILSPIVVPTEQMEQFIHAVTTQHQSITYVDLAEAQIKQGTPVRIIGGDFVGFEGVLERIKGKRDRRVCVNIEGIVAYKFDVAANFVEII